MSPSQPYSCFLIGADSLLIECGEILLNASVDVRGVITSTPRLEEWASSRGIRVISDRDDYASMLSEERFDVLFSITHLRIIPEDVLSMPARWAINFHDGPLPRYAGLNAPAWALMRGEERYGVTWHVMEAGADTGDILEQRIFDVEPGDTSLTLNTRCFEHAIRSFQELVPKLANGSETRTAQALEERTYFGRHDRPECAGVLDWTRPAIELERIVRALDFGPYANPLGTAKITHGESGVTVLSAVADGSNPAEQAGTILSIGEGDLTVAAGEGALRITGIERLDGSPISVDEFAAQLGLRAGIRLTTLDEDSRRRFTDLATLLGRHESKWANRLQTLSPASIPFTDSADANAVGIEQRSVDVPESFARLFGERASEAFLAVLLVHLGRTNVTSQLDLGWTSERRASDVAGCGALVSPVALLRAHLDWSRPLEDLVDAVHRELEELDTSVGWLRDLVSRRPALDANLASPQLPVAVREGPLSSAPSVVEGSAITVTVRRGDTSVSLTNDRRLLSEARCAQFVAQLEETMRSVVERPDQPIGSLRMLPAEFRERILNEWNDTALEVPGPRCIHQAFESWVDRSPEAPCVGFEGTNLTYADVESRANRLARRLVDLGAGKERFVGIYLDRSHELLIAVLAVLKSGAAYLPLDPAFPADRIAHMVADARCELIVTDSVLAAQLPSNEAELVLLDRDAAEIAKQPNDRRPAAVDASNLAYIIYTSGSTGVPKGVLVEHGNVTNFFAGMDARVGMDQGSALLAVTSLSFDISVLELLWTLARGHRVVVYRDRLEGASASTNDRKIDFSLYLWGNDDTESASKYELMLEAAKFGDRNGFKAIWTPERHFHAFGGPYPNPAVTSAAIATITESIEIRAGSCVLPLHNCLRVAEEWAVVDNLSNGRIGMAIASGWQPDDFVLQKENYPNNKERMFEMISDLRRHWKGEPVPYVNPLGQEFTPTPQPRPVQRELPIWITAAGNPETFQKAGELGANLLTHLLGQSLEELEEKLDIYRKARADHGHDPASGIVTLMLHTFVGDNEAETKELVRGPMKSYLRSATNLVKHYAWSFPAFRRPDGEDIKPDDLDLESLTEEETDAMMEHAFSRYFETSGLFGTPASCLRRVDELKAIGVDDIGCLIDYGLPTSVVLDMLPNLTKLMQLAAPSATGAMDTSFHAQAEREGITHVQCTPSMARILCAEPASKSALSKLSGLMIGGEQFPVDLAHELRTALAPSASLTNMYGPTETTIWSSTHSIDESDVTSVSIGRPICNTQLYVLDAQGEPQPPGVAGELFIGGHGVVRGYHERPELTAERFVEDPFRITAAEESPRMYRTGDVAYWNDDGTIGFLGRVDHQVKLRGYRIELGEIESILGEDQRVGECVVMVREDEPGDQRLVAYVVGSTGAKVTEQEAKALLRHRVPEYMIPSNVIALERFPLTPNGKIDRLSLPSVADAAPETATVVAAPKGALEESLLKLWREVLGRDEIGVDDNFFDIGGHSLLVVKLHRQLESVTSQPLMLTDVYRFPTIRSLSEFMESTGPDESVQKSTARGAKRRELRRRRTNR